MSTKTFELFLVSKQISYRKSIKANNTEQIKLSRVQQSDFEYSIRIQFLNSRISKLIIKESLFFLNYIPKCLIKICFKDFSNFEFSPENSFIYNLSDCSIHQADNDQHLIITNLQHVTQSFIQLADSIKLLYEEYKKDSVQWIERYCPEKRKSLCAYWNIPKKNSFIEISEVEYKKRINQDPPHCFVNFTIVIFPINDKKIKFIAFQTQRFGSDNKFKTTTIEKPSKVDIKDVIKELTLNFNQESMQNLGLVNKGIEEVKENSESAYSPYNEGNVSLSISNKFNFSKY